MAAWHRSRGADLGIRALGILLCAIAYGAFRHIAARPVTPQSADASAVGLAAIGFLAASAGGALTMLGQHPFDRIEVGPRRSGDAIDSMQSQNEDTDGCS